MKYLSLVLSAAALAGAVAMALIAPAHAATGAGADALRPSLAAAAPA